MVWDVWANGRIVATFQRHELDDAYAHAFKINARKKGSATVRPRELGRPMIPYREYGPCFKGIS